VVVVNKCSVSKLPLVIRSRRKFCNSPWYCCWDMRDIRHKDVSTNWRSACIDRRQRVRYSPSRSCRNYDNADSARDHWETRTESTRRCTPCHFELACTCHTLSDPINDTTLTTVSPALSSIKTTNLSYSKDDCAMRPIYGCPEHFRESLSTPTATSAEMFNGLLFTSILWMCVQNLKFVASCVPQIIGNTWKNWTVSGYAHAPFSPKFYLSFCWMDSVNVLAKCEVCSCTLSWDSSDWSFRWELRTHNLGKEEAVGGRDGTVRKSVGEFKITAAKQPSSSVIMASYYTSLFYAFNCLKQIIVFLSFFTLVMDKISVIDENSDCKRIWLWYKAITKKYPDKIWNLQSVKSILVLTLLCCAIETE